MDQIYAGSEVTLVATAGEDSEHGLPGVQKHREDVQQNFIVPGAMLKLVLPHLSHALRDSKWASRAWTYQEFFLSRRRLVFTDREAYFICNGAYCSESIKQPIENLTIWGNTSFHGIMPPQSKGLDRAYDNVLSLQKQIAAYSGKDLTYDSDILNACMGLLNSYRLSKIQPVYQIWGVPLEPSERGGVLMRLTWHHKRPTFRRKGFPSWSWAGWKGAVDFPRTHGAGKFNVHPSLECQVRVQIQISQHLQPLQDVLCRQMAGKSAGRPLDLPQELHISSIYVMLTFTSFDEISWDTYTSVSYEDSIRDRIIPHSRRGLHCVLPLSPTLTALAPVFLDEEMATDFVALCLVLFNSKEIPVAIIVLKDCGGYYERVGYVPLWLLEDYLGVLGEASAIFVDENWNVLERVTIKPGSRPWMFGGESKTIKLR